MQKKLYRSINNKVIAGVLGGLAEYFGHDPVVWRIGAIILFILSGFMPLALIYAIAWVIIPEDPGIAYTVDE
jgi:phage shock protein C